MLVGKLYQRQQKWFKPVESKLNANAYASSFPYSTWLNYSNRMEQKIKF